MNLKRIKRHSALLLTSLIIIGAASFFLLPHSDRSRRNSVLSLPTLVRAAEVNPWTRAIEKIKEDRGEPTGKQAKIEIPSQLRHYSDTRRFLAVQVAEWRQHTLKTPEDLVELAAMINRGEFVTVKPVTENYVLFGVGGNAGKDPFTRYENGKSISVYDEAGLKREYERLAASAATTEKSLATVKHELAGAGKRERAKRNKLKAQINGFEKSLKALREEKQQLDRNYGDAQARQELFDAHASLRGLGKSFPDRDFDIADANERRELKVRILSSLRPEALKVMEEIAESYSQKFQRPLPITSLVRPDEYQHALSKVNPNATRIETPPHSTGLAFDIYYRYMTAAEQAHVMSHLAQLKDAGRIEVLRENRDHYHVFAFVDGARPKEDLISASLGHNAAKAATVATPARAAKPAKAAKQRQSAKASGKSKSKAAKKSVRRRR